MGRTSMVEDRLIEWASYDSRKAHVVGYPEESQAHRAYTEGPNGMLAKGPTGDGGMYGHYRHHRHEIEEASRIRQMNSIVFRMRFTAPDYYDIIRVAYFGAKPGHVLPRQAAAEKLGISETTYRRRHERMLAYVEGAIDYARAA